jgi:putative ATP-binding cassette transporter
MRLLIFLLKASWRTVLWAALVGAVSGVASIAMVAFILLALKQPDGSPLTVVSLFAALCLIVLATRIGSNMLLMKLTQESIARLRMGLCRRILESPLRHLEEIGVPSMLGSLTGDVGIVARAMNGVPVLAISTVILLGGAVYLATLDPKLLLGLVVFSVLGVASYWYASRFAHRYVGQTRAAYDTWMKHARSLLEGVKELKMHHDRRREFVDDVLQPAEDLLCDYKYRCDTLFDAAVVCGRTLFFVAIGLLLFAWPRIFPTDSDTLRGYVLTIFFLMSPLEQVMAWLPLLAYASVSMQHIERLGLMLEEVARENVALAPIERWEQIDLAGVTHAYRRDGHSRNFVLGPIDLSLRPGQIVFIVGGNGTGKTTLAKLLTGLYVPESGEIRVDGRPITDENREGYRQLFSVVFDDAAVFESLWGLGAADLDQRAKEYLQQLELDHVVTVTGGTFSTTQLSRGQRKRLALLTAYLEDRPIYVFDEWAADQDPTFRKVFYLRLLPELKRRGKAVVAVTHDDRYFATADCVIKLEEGKIVQSIVPEPARQPELGNM